jgi:hypothetical protein
MKTLLKAVVALVFAVTIPLVPVLIALDINSKDSEVSQENTCRVLEEMKQSLAKSHTKNIEGFSWMKCEQYL